ncbi:MAG: HPr(Ser) kinase/phosphatase [Elusimicrobiota bacterium]
MPGITVSTFLKEKSEDLKLSLLAGKDGLSREINVFEINRPGLALTGFLEHFPQNRIQIIGALEHSYLNSIPKEKQAESLNKLLSFKSVPFFIMTRGLDIDKHVHKVFDKHNVPLLQTSLRTSQLVSNLIFYLEDKLAVSTRAHGVLVSVYGLGVLIVGNAGIGKSECALELVKRGHMLVADDIVEIRRRSGGILMGRGEEIIKHHMEVRGLGIINVRSLFGIGFILDESRIELCIRLEDWDPSKEYERVGLEERTTTVLDVKIPEVILPVRPGRNLAVLVEIASLNQRLKNQGHYTAQELNQRLINVMMQR